MRKIFHECGTLLTKKQVKGKWETNCKKCERVVEENLKSQVLTIKEKDKNETVVIPEKIITGPVVRYTCENKDCKTGLAYEMVKPPMFGDEDDLILNKCVDCGKVTREGTKIG